jgi:hypothetical protein
MVKNIMDKQIVQYLHELAAKKAWDDDDNFIVDDYAAGNEDDAFYGGQRSGEIGLARELLRMIE